MIDLSHSNKLIAQHSVVTQHNPPPAPVSKQTTKELTRKEKQFVENYLYDFNGSRAYAEVFKKSNGHKHALSSRYTISSEVLNKPYIRAYVDRRISEISEPLTVRAEKTMRELRSVAFSNMKNYLSFGKDGMEWKESKDLTDEQLAAVSSVSETITQHGGTRSIKLHDKIPALVKYGETAKLFQEDKLKDINIAVQVVNVR